MYSTDIVFFSLQKHAGFRAGLLNRMVKYYLSYTIDYIIIGRILMNLYFFYNFSNIFTIHSQRQATEGHQQGLVRETENVPAGKIRTLVSMLERDFLIKSSRRSSSEERSFTMAFKAIYKQFITACPEFVSGDRNETEITKAKVD